MSDFLSILDSIDGGEVTLDASFGGVPFEIIDSRHPPGRRVLRFLFPGQDQAAYQDLGQDDGELRISGLLIGDDYRQQAAALETAFQTPGPATLDHPWLGSLLVVLIDKPEISFASEELRVVRFTATFARVQPRRPPTFDTQASLFGELAALRQAAFGLLHSVLGVVSRVLGIVGFVRGFVGSVVGFFGLAVANLTGLTSELLGPATGPALAALGASSSLPINGTYADTLGALLAGPSAAAVTSSQPSIPAAVAPGGDTETPPAADARLVSTMLLSVAAQIAALPPLSTTTRALMLTTQALVVADAVAAASDIVFTSQQDAAGWLAMLSAALDALAAAAQLAGVTSPAAAGTVWRAAVASKSALAIDMNAQIGRLPAVVAFTPPQAVPVWLLAQYLSGDRPNQVFATYFDLVARNGIENPALPVSGPIETLVPV